jgi:hypothetical protein
MAGMLYLQASTGSKDRFMINWNNPRPQYPAYCSALARPAAKYKKAAACVYEARREQLQSKA